MRPIRIGSASRIEIGYDGENGAREIVFDATQWMEEMPGCTAAMTVERADGQTYMAPDVTKDEEKKTITWTLTSAETIAGEGRAQLLWMDGERIAKQAIFTTVCHESLQSDATQIDVPEPVWAQKSLTAAQEAKKSAEAAAASEIGAENALKETKSVRDAAKQEIEEKKLSAIAGIENAKTEAIVAIQAEKEEIAPPIICAASGTTSIAISDSADRPLRGLTVYGKTTQDGTPSIDAPVELTSVGDAGNVELTVARGLPDTIVIIKQPRNLAGAVGDTAIFEVIALGYGLTYQWQWIGLGATDMWANTGLSGNKTASLVVPVTKERNGFRYRCVITDAKGHTVTTKEASLTVGNVAESDDTADETQTATISTAEGLRGVPVASGAGTYTDADGQGWIADTVEYDAETGTAKIVKRIGIIESYAGETIGTTYMSTTGDLTDGACVIYPLESPIETIVAADDLCALRSRYPETTVYNDAGAHMAVKYIADTKNYIDMKIAAIASATIGG